jgi:hypothetical protein
MLIAKVSLWVATTILRESDTRSRALKLQRFITIGRTCQKLHNYNTSMAILAGLNNAYVVRLHSSWKIVSPKSREQLEVLKDMTHSNYKSLREALKNAESIPMIPCIAVLLQDANQFGSMVLLTEEGEFQRPRMAKIGALVRNVLNCQKAFWNMETFLPLQRLITSALDELLSDSEMRDRSFLFDP